jgi:hypothetical protein
VATGLITITFGIGDETEAVEDDIDATEIETTGSLTLAVAIATGVVTLSETLTTGDTIDAVAFATLVTETDGVGLLPVAVEAATVVIETDGVGDATDAVAIAGGDVSLSVTLIVGAEAEAVELAPEVTITLGVCAEAEAVETETAVILMSGTIVAIDAVEVAGTEITVLPIVTLGAETLAVATANVVTIT